MTHNNMNVINQETGEIIQNMKPSPIKPPEAPRLPAAYNKGKSGQQLDTLISAFYRPLQYSLDVYLGENEYGVKYCHINNQFLFIDSIEFKDEIINLATTYLGFSELSNTALKNFITVLRTNESFWNKDFVNFTTPSIRITNQGTQNSFYALTPQNFIPLFRSNFMSAPTIGLLRPKQASWNINSYPSDFFSYQNLNAMRQYPFDYNSNLSELLRQLQIPEELSLLMTATLIHSLVTDSDHLLLEITGDSESHCSMVFSNIKKLIDPVLEISKPLPKRADDIKRYAFEEYLISFENPDNKKLKQEQQEALLQLLKGTATAHALQKSKYPSKCTLKRPVTINSPDTVINLGPLRKRTVSINLPKTSNLSFHVIEGNLIANARLELLRLTQSISHVIFPDPSQCRHKYKIELNEFHELQNLILIGSELSEIFSGSPDKFVSQFTEWAIEDLFMQFDDNDTAYLFYLWAEEHKGNTATQPMKGWKNELTYYAESEEIDLSKVSERKLSADLKQAISLLRKLGIECESSGRSKRLSSWTITVNEEVGLRNTITVQEYAPTEVPNSTF